MALWNVTPLKKYGIHEETVLSKNDMRIKEVTQWRSGGYTIKSVKKPKYVEGCSPADLGDVEDWLTNDGSSEYEFSGMTKRQVASAQKVIDSEGLYGLENKGWQESDSETYICGGVMIEKMK